MTTGMMAVPFWRASFTTPFRAIRNITHSSGLCKANVDIEQRSFKCSKQGKRIGNGFSLVDEDDLLDSSRADDRTEILRQCSEDVFLVNRVSIHPCIYVLHQRNFEAQRSQTT